jgi:flagellar L-ring protein precursor FlgH
MKNLALALFLLTNAACSVYTHPQTSNINESLQEDLNKDIIANYLKAAKETPKNGSLWQSGSKGFFKDNRAKAVGDIITVNVTVQISANTTANTSATQTNDSKSGITKLLNLTDNITHAGLATGAAGLLDSASNRSFSGSGTTDRKDSLSTTVAAVVTQVLPNNHLVIRGKREVSINYEMQELNIAGIIRPEDISANNTISSNQIAQARIAYGGKGVVNEVQTKKWGVKFIDRWMPF